MTVQMKEVTTLKELKTFIRFPLSLYRNHPCYVPTLVFDDLNTLRRDKNPAFEHCQARYWLAYRDGKVVGRIAGILNRLHIEKWGQNYIRFGWVDFVDDPAVSAALFEQVEGWAAENKMTAVHGPLGFTDMDREGMLVEGFDELGTLATIYNYPYYPQHLEAMGYAKDVDWVEFEVKVPTEPVEKIEKLTEIVKKRYNLRIADFGSKREMLKYADALFDLLDTTYNDLYGVVPLTRAQVDAYIKQYFGFITPDFVPIVLDEHDEMIAFGISMPSLSKALQRSKGSLFPFGFLHFLKALRWNDRGDLYLVAVKPEYQGRGVNAIMIDHMYGVFRRLGIHTIESNPELETNLLVQGQWKYFEHRQHKRRRVYIKQLG
jgi:GNAT superfamily N-acetyltransferase